MWFSGASSKFVKSLRAWTKTGGPLDLALPPAFRVTTAAQAIAVCDALSSGDIFANARISPPLDVLTRFFQTAEATAATDVFRERGLPILRKILRERLRVDGQTHVEDAPISSTLLFVTKVIALYADADDAGLIVDVARAPSLADAYLWEVVFSTLRDHPSAIQICEALRDPLPTGFEGIAYLDFANTLARDGRISAHPFSSHQGMERLMTYVSSADPDTFSYAVSAAAAVPFLAPSAREALVAAGEHHSDSLVRIEFAWAREKSGDASGRQALAAFSAEPRFASRAMRYLEELGLGEVIPAAARAPAFRAQAEMCDWLAHPSEFGAPPDRISLFDGRTLFWPPTNDRRPVWLLKYEYDASADRAEADVGVGMVGGSTTFALFGETTADLSAEDVYGLHCCFELEMNSDARAPKKRSAALGRMMLAKHNRGF